MGKYTWFIVTFSILPVMVLVGVILLWAIGPAEETPSQADGIEKDFQLYLEVREKLKAHYDGELDDIELRNAALQGLAGGTGDKYTRVLPPIEAKEQSRGLGGGFFGIGTYIEHNDDSSIRITGVQPGGGAEAAGLLKDDVIVSVDGVSIIGLEPDNNVARIKGDEEGSVVRLTVQRGGDPTTGTDPDAKRLNFDVKRTRVIQYSVHDVHIEEAHGRRFGYVQVSDFNNNTFDPQFKDAVAELTAKGAEGLVIDLRGNGGGRVAAAADFVDGLLDGEEEVVVFTHSSRESNQKHDRVYRTKDAEALTRLPIVVLADDSTASAAEIVTGALKDHGRAFVIGQRTFGKGLVQTVFELTTDPNYAVNITTSQYFTPLGRQVQNGRKGEPGGIRPDLEIQWREGEQSRVHARLRDRQARNNREEIAEASSWWDYEDRMLNAALDILAGKPVTVTQD